MKFYEKDSISTLEKYNKKMKILSSNRIKTFSLTLTKVNLSMKEMMNEIKTLNSSNSTSSTNPLLIKKYIWKKKLKKKKKKKKKLIYNILTIRILNYN